MFKRIKKQIDAKLKGFIGRVENRYRLRFLSPILAGSFKNFVLRDGKRIRPILFVAGYLGFCKKKASGLYTSALAIELLHDFMLIHDDIIDKSKIRRGKPSMHIMLDSYLKPYKNLKFNGQDLAIVIGDIMYAIAIDAFLAINEDPKRKEKALKNFIKAAAYTGAGEFIELLAGAKPLDKISKNDIYKIYDYKTARYTFSTPLSTGAILAGARSSEIKKLIDFGIYLGRAFQIKDDILGIFGDEKKIGKSSLTDLQENKKTLLAWHAYNHSSKQNKSALKAIMSKDKVTKTDLKKVQKIIISSKSLEYAKNEITTMVKKSIKLLESSKLKPTLRKELKNYFREILTI